jgi:hypothetical protein
MTSPRVSISDRATGRFSVMVDLPARPRTAAARARSTPAEPTPSVPDAAGGRRRAVITRTHQVLASIALLAVALVGRLQRRRQRLERLAQPIEIEPHEQFRGL